MKLNIDQNIKVYKKFNIKLNLSVHIISIQPNAKNFEKLMQITW